MRNNKLIHEGKSAGLRLPVWPPDSNRTRIEISWLESEIHTTDCRRVAIGHTVPTQERVRIFSLPIRSAPLTKEGASCDEESVQTLNENRTKQMNTLLKALSAEAAAAPMRIPANLTPRILVVEDDEAIRQFNAQVLLRSGYHVDAAEDGVAGWEALQAKNFDLLLTDHEMPRLTGLELVKKVRSARMTLPVILATGTLPVKELERHPWLHLAATLLKPFSPHELLETVQQALRADDRASSNHAPRFPSLADTFRQSSPYQHGGPQ